MSAYWATARELCGLPGLSPSERITRQMLLASGVPHRPRVQSRGRPPIEFSCEQLPGAARAAWAQRAADYGPEIATRARTRVAHADDKAARPRGGRLSTLTPEIEQVLLALIGHRQGKSAAFLRDAVSRQLCVPLNTLPDERTFRRWAKNIRKRHAMALMAIHDPEGYRSRRRAAFGSMSERFTHANQEWQADGTKSDVTLQDGRWTVMGLMDVWTRRVMFVVAHAEDTQAFKALLRRAILAWGWPESIKVDQGSAFVSRDTTLTLQQLGIAHVPLPPASPDRKPFVERCFRSLQHDWLEMLPGYSGHNVAEASQLRARARAETGRAEIVGTLTRADLQRALDTWSREIYGRRIHAGIGEAPETRAARSEPARAPMDIRDLDRLLSPLDGTRTVTKVGLKLDGAVYISAELGRHVGATVHVRRDTLDLGTAYVFDGHGQFLCEAHNPQLRGIDREAVAREARRLQSREIAIGREQVRAAVRAVKPGDLALRVLRVEPTENASVIDLPVARPARRQVQTGSDRLDQLRAALMRCLDVAAQIDAGIEVCADKIVWAQTWIGSSAANSIVEFLVGRGELPANWQPPASIAPARRANGLQDPRNGQNRSIA